MTHNGVNKGPRKVRHGSIDDPHLMVQRHPTPNPGLQQLMDTLPRFDRVRGRIEQPQRDAS